MKEAIVKLLKENKSDFISGEKISELFGVSRTAIWKYINILKDEGYEIESVSRKGYRLISSPDILTYEEIEEWLNTEYIGRKIHYYDTIDSTNIKAKKIAYLEKEGTIVVAESQSKGRGRLGREWQSPKGKGLWMSIILKPKVNPVHVAKVTLIGAAAVNLALEDIGIDSYIKWPNDIVINGKKICGILTEMSSELNMINYVVMGIGINVNLDKKDFSKEILDKGTSLKIEAGKEINRKKLLATVLNKFEELYTPFTEEEDLSQTIEICRKNSILLEKDIRVINNGKERIGKAIDINDDGNLIVKYENGEIESLLSGEISVRGLEGYV
ncbi:MAG TPA: biotin--[acetyl-CoA-carboxylase] ligase [Tissierellales bacterium]|nr:biotin--[acetyl-CoA-carboxylase] ligase [Tissierellales bacterium]